MGCYTFGYGVPNFLLELCYRSFPSTSQKNGQAECKHGYILDIVRALLLPENIKGHTMLTAVYSINRVPFPTILHKSSHDYHCYIVIATVYESHSLPIAQINPL